MIGGIQSGHMPWAITVVVMSMVSLAYQFKMQNEAFYSGASEGRRERSSDRAGSTQPVESVFATVPMIALAVGCVGLAWLVWPGLEHPYLIGPAAEVLMRGVVAP